MVGSARAVAAGVHWGGAELGCREDPHGVGARARVRLRDLLQRARLNDNLPQIDQRWDGGSLVGGS